MRLFRVFFASSDHKSHLSLVFNEKKDKKKFSFHEFTLKTKQNAVYSNNYGPASAMI